MYNLYGFGEYHINFTNSEDDKGKYKLLSLYNTTVCIQVFIFYYS